MGSSFAFNARPGGYAREQFVSPHVAATDTTATQTRPAGTTGGRSTISRSIAPRRRASISSPPRRRHERRVRSASRRRATTSGEESGLLPITKSAVSSLKDFARLLVREDLALHALERVVDRLRVAAEPFGHVLVGRAFEIEPERVRLEAGEPGAEAADEALQLLGRDHHHRRLMHGRPGQGVAERALSVRVLARRGMAERDVGVERRVLEAGRGLDRGDDLPRHAEFREAAERRLLVGAEVAHRLVEADEALLDQVLRVAAGEEVRARLQAHEAGVAADERVHRDAVAVPGSQDELQILKLALSFLR